MLEEEIELDKKYKHTIEVVVDRLAMKATCGSGSRSRSRPRPRSPQGVIDVVDGDELTFSENSRAPSTASRSRSSSRASSPSTRPHGACPRCTGLGAQLEIDPDLLVPDTSISINEGALVPWTIGSQSFYDSVIEAIAERYEIARSTRRGATSAEEQDRFLYGTGGDRIFVTYRNRMGRKRQYTMAKGSSSPTSSAATRRPTVTAAHRIEEYMSFPGPSAAACFKPEVLAVTIGERLDPRFTQMSVTRRFASSTSSSRRRPRS